MTAHGRGGNSPVDLRCSAPASISRHATLPVQQASEGASHGNYLHRMVEPDHREAFVRDPEASFEAAGLSDEERDLIRRRDWRRLLHYGVIFFMLEKLGAVVGVSNLHIYAAMRGETLEAFQRTRNAPGALYSVAGKSAGKLDWDSAEKGNN
ncbi:Protocatechuate 4,5-dioxygenase (fragment) [Paraburkholderia ribeironis]|uniref:Protocatechuate 4,5-dioxygenase n=1 Tax=Paraburkholderia ribeironis TaxID=1247936 RepID=A0A1N7S998_9BURK